MNIKCSELENMNISLDYFNSIKQIGDELSKYIKNYKQLIQEFMKKLQNFQSNFKKKLTKAENPKLNQIILLTSKITKLIDQNAELYQLSIDDIELRLREFDTFIKLKSETIKTIQKLSSDLNKNLFNSYTEANKAKSNYLNSLSKTEEIINKYYTDNNRLKQHENGLGDKLNENEYTLLKEQQKIQLNDMKNIIKISKNLETIYKNAVSSSVVAHDKFVENHNKFRDKIKKITCELSDEIKTLVVSFMLSYKNNFKQPLSNCDLYTNELNLLDEGKEVDTIISQDFKNDNPLIKISPFNYKLKSISLLKDSNYMKKEENKPKNNNNKFALQRTKSISKLEDGFEEMEYISDESLILTIKSLFDNFTLVDKDEFDLKSEENKSKTQKYILKIITNMNSYPYAKYGKNNDKKKINLNSEYKRNELTTEEIIELKELLENHYSRIIFLQKLSDYRSRGKFYLCIEDYTMLSKFFNIIADKVKRDMDYHAAEMAIIISQTYCLEEGKRKKYLQVSLKENKLFKDKTFWEEFLFYSINKEIMKTMERDQKIKENKRNSDNKITNVVFSQLLTLIDNMFEFDIEPDTVREILEPKIKYYKLNDSLKSTINDVILAKQTEKAIEKEELEKENKKMEEEKKSNEENIKKEENIKNNDQNTKDKTEENNIKNEDKNIIDTNKNVKKEAEKEIKDDAKKNETKEGVNNKEEAKKEETEKEEAKNEETEKEETKKEETEKEEAKKDEIKKEETEKKESDEWEVMNVEK